MRTGSPVTGGAELPDIETPIHWLGVAELSRRIGTRSLSPVEVTEHLLARIEALDGDLHAYRAVTADRARAEARAAEAEVEAGRAVGPLHGIPYAAKDLFDVRGEATTAGSNLLADHVADRDAAVVARLGAAGMILLGKTHTVEFAFGGVGINHSQGTPRNPWSREHYVPGGSSSGSGVAVAAGLAPAALGTDTGGSVRIPASLCGTVGLKTTCGTVSRSGVFPLSRTLDSVGPLTRHVLDAALLFDAMRGPDARDPAVFQGPMRPVSERIHEGVRGMRLGLPRNRFWDDVDPEVARAVRDAAEVLAGLGGEVADIDLPEVDALRAGKAVAAEAFSVHRARLARDFERMDPIVANRIARGEGVTAGEYLESIDGWDRLRASLVGRLEAVDALLVPTTMIPARPVSEVDTSIEVYTRFNARYLRNTAIGNMLGLCGLSVPCGLTSDGLPIGLMIYGKPFAEGEILRVGAAFEGVSDRRRYLPDVR